MKHNVWPFATANGINNVGWHTYRHSFDTLLKANGEVSKPSKSSYGTRTAGSPWMFMPGRLWHECNGSSGQIEAALPLRGAENYEMAAANELSLTDSNSLLFRVQVFNVFNQTQFNGQAQSMATLAARHSATQSARHRHAFCREL
jgi:hypothetical protein